MAMRVSGKRSTQRMPTGFPIRTSYTPDCNSRFLKPEGEPSMRTKTRAAALASSLIFFVALAACGKKDEGTVVDTTALGTQTATVAVDTTPLKVSDIQVGKAIGSDKKVANQTTDFGVRDTIYVAVITTGAAKNAKVEPKW